MRHLTSHYFNPTPVIAKTRTTGYLTLALFALFLARPIYGQLDQGAITGIVTDPQGAAVPRANVQLTNADTNFTLEAQTDKSGVYTFQPIKIGHYSVTVGAPGFSTTTKSGLELQVNQRLEADVRLRVGSTTQSVQVNAAATPLLQTQDASTGQAMTTAQINDIPLNQRNYVFLAQLSTGVSPSNGSRGQGNGDFNANGQRATENNFILDGVDNNSNSIDFLNAASYNVKPPPDALQEFEIQTANSSAQFGHSAGGVVNASIKSGTNQFHGDVWEYFRNNALGEASPTEWASGVTVPTTVEPYHQNQFGGTIGGPIVKNKLFFFFDYEGNRIIEDFPAITSVPTVLMKSQPGNLSELLNPSLTGVSGPWLVYEPNSGGTKPLGSACGNPQNVMCSSEISPVALKLFLAAYPAPNTAPPGQTYNNYAWSQVISDITNQFDTRVDYNLSTRDQVFGRISWSRENKYVTAPLGPIFDGGPTDNDGTFINYAKNAVFSWNHVFSSTLINQARFAYNWGSFAWFQQSYNNGTLDAQYGLGGLAPYSPSLGNGGLPQLYVNEFPEIGPPLFQPSPEGQNVYQIIDDATKIHGNHSFKFGVDFQNVRYSVYQPTFGKAAYNYAGGLTSMPGSPLPTGYGIADFLSNQMDEGFESNPTPSNLGRWYRSAYFQDDWKVNSRLTLNLGLRYDYFSAPIERNDNDGEFYSTGPLDVPAGGTGVYLLPKSKENVPLSPIFTTDLAEDNIKLEYSSNRALLNMQHKNFAPRLGISYSPTNKLVIRSGFGLYYDGVENLGNYPNLGANYPFDIEQNWFAPSCLPNNCPSDGLYLETGPPSSGLAAPTLVGWDHNVHTTYAMQQNLSVQMAITNNMTATLGYTGSETRHLAVVVWPSFSAALLPPGVNNAPYQPFPAFNGNIHSINFGAIANYNSLQAKLERRFSNGLSFLSSYTWAHNLDDSREPLPSNGDGGDRSYNIIGLRPDYANSPFNVYHRFIFTGTYELPVGAGRRYLNTGGLTNILVGGWSSTLLFRTQTGKSIYRGLEHRDCKWVGSFSLSDKRSI
jgi:outer membrane receptor protein involved in Fe transport